MKKTAVRRNQQGFTIIELMIATMVFAVFLLLLANMVIQISRTYTKGINGSKVQETARSVSTELSRAIQFSGAPQVYSDRICIGSQRYRYVLGKQVIDGGTANANQTFHALVVDDGGVACLAESIPDNTSFAANDRELIPTGNRLANLTLVPVGATSLWQLKVRVIYGADDLVCSPSANDCASTSTSVNLGNTDLACKTTNGSQYCAASELSTIIDSRL